MLQGKLTTESTLTGSLDCGFVEPTLAEKNITANGTYNASADNVDGYSKVNVDVEPTLTTKNITQNGTYNASDDNVDGYSQVNVNVSGGGDVPTIHNLTPNQNLTVTYAYYFEIGNTVFCCFRCYSNSVFTTSDIIFSGLPKPVGNLRFPTVKYENNNTSNLPIKISFTTGEITFETSQSTSNTKYFTSSFFYEKAVET